MGHYRSNVRDIEFNLFEVLDLDAILATGAFDDLDGETVRSILSTGAEVAEGPIAASFTDGDRNPPVYDPETFTVTLSPELRASIDAWRESGMPMLGLSPELDGIPAPRLVSQAVTELGLGANPAAVMYEAGAPFADILFDLGNEQQKHWAKLAIDRRWGSTMVLTEPDAGSDVGAGRTTATEQPDGTWHIEGVKRFITSADSGDLYENIYHLVLARPQGAGPGTKGLSLFYVPKFHHDPQTGEPGERNGVYVTNVEHKMGLKASATCEVTFGQHGTPAVGWLVGDTHEGIKQMFHVIENARMMVGVKAMSTLSTGYLNALEYAKARVQGADLTSGGSSAPRVTIMHHPDVRRSLLSQKAHAEGLRALYLYTAAHQDPVSAEITSGAEPGLAHRVNDLLLPIVKGFSSERAHLLLVESLQTLGGSGYLQDYPIEQYLRDAKIDTLYEGTTAIQAQDLLFRKIFKDGGQAFGHVLSQIQETIAADGGLGEERALLGEALEHVQQMAGALTGFAMQGAEDKTALYKVGLGSVDFLFAFGDLLIGWLLVRQALVAKAALDGGSASAADQDFYAGKLAVAHFFAHQYLPRIAAARAVVEAIDGAAMQVPEGAF